MITLGVTVIGLSTFAITQLKVQQTQTSKNTKEVECKAAQPMNDVLYAITDIEKQVDFYYDIDVRFATSITKEKLNASKNMFEIFPAHATEGIKELYNTKVGVFTSKGEVIIEGKNEVLTESQINLLKMATYSSDFYIHGNFKNDFGTEDYIVYYMTVVPDIEAEYEMGKDALLYYLKENSKEIIKEVKKEKLQPGKIRFIVDSTGHIKSAKLDATSGYDDIDTKMLELIKKSPGKWNPAKDAKGNYIEQELVYSFGIVGC